MEKEDKHKTSVEEQGIDKGKAPVASGTSTVGHRWKNQSVKNDIVATQCKEERCHNSYVANQPKSSLVDDIIEALKPGRNINTIGVCGSDSTFIDVVFNRAKRDMFQVVAMATVSDKKQKPNNNKIQDEIAKYLKLTFNDEKNVTERAKELHQKLQKMGNNVLVILRDLCKDLDLKKVGIPSSGTTSSGYKLLLTSESGEVLLKQMPPIIIFNV